MKGKERRDGTKIGVDGKIPWDESGREILKRGPCYETPREERVSYAFKHLISNIKLHNGVKISIAQRLGNHIT